MIRSIYFAPDGAIQKDLSIPEIGTWLQKQEGLLWVSLENPTPNEVEEILSTQFHFHHLAIEDCLSTGYQTPKVDDFGSYIFIIAHAVAPRVDFRDLDTRELDFFLSDNYLVTCHIDDSMPPIELTWNQLARDERLSHNGADFLCHAVLDVLVDQYMPILDQMDEEIEWLEDQVLSRPEPKTLERVLQLKHSIMTLRRIVSPQRELMNRLTRDEFPMIDRQSRIYFRDIYDHLVRIQDLGESIRDIVSGSLDIYLSSTSLRLNEVMKALTIVSTIFLPMSFVAGVYGMNFLHMPELSWGYPAVWAVFLLIPVGMISFFKRRHWF